MTAIEVSNLSCQLGRKQLFRKMSWKLEKGKFLAITGVSGSGKTTLLKILSGVTQTDEGEIRISSRPVGMVFQNFRLTPNLSVLKNVLCGRLGAYGWYQTLFSFPETERQNAFRILCELGLEKLLYQEVRKISGGEQQRTAIGRVLLQNPEIILADEPTSNLDAGLAQRVLKIFRRKCAEENRTVVVVLHDKKMVTEFADCELKIGIEFENGWHFRDLIK
jgi:phosphonate transport system ATP-binding protein